MEHSVRFMVWMIHFVTVTKLRNRSPGARKTGEPEFPATAVQSGLVEVLTCVFNCINHGSIQWRPILRQVGLGLPEDFVDGLAVGVGQVAEGGRVFAAGEDFPHAAVDVLFCFWGGGVELFGVDEVAAGVARDAWGEV